MDYLKPVLGIFLIALAVYFILGEGKIKISANPGTAFVCACKLPVKTSSIATSEYINCFIVCSLLK